MHNGGLDTLQVKIQKLRRKVFIYEKSAKTAWNYKHRFYPSEQDPDIFTSKEETGLLYK